VSTKRTALSPTFSAVAISVNCPLEMYGGSQLAHLKSYGMQSTLCLKSSYNFDI
jgi:hypothetical protein